MGPSTVILVVMMLDAVCTAPSPTTVPGNVSRLRRSNNFTLIFPPSWSHETSSEQLPREVRALRAAGRPETQHGSSANDRRFDPLVAQHGTSHPRQNPAPPSGGDGERPEAAAFPEQLAEGVGASEGRHGADGVDSRINVHDIGTYMKG